MVGIDEYVPHEHVSGNLKAMGAVPRTPLMPTLDEDKVCALTAQRERERQRERARVKER